MHLCSTLEAAPYEALYDLFMEAFEGFRITKEVTFDSFCEMLGENEYDPGISVGAFEESAGGLAGFVLNCIKTVDNRKIAYDILTATKPICQRRGIAADIFAKVKLLLRQKQVRLYHTEVLKSNTPALRLYQAQGFKISREVTSVLPSKDGSRIISQYELVLEL